VASIGLVYALGFVLFGFIQGWSNIGRILQDPHKIQYVLDASATAFTLLNLVAAFIAVRVQSWITLSTIHAALDGSVGFRGALRNCRGRGYAFLALFVLQQVAIQIGMVLFLLPGLFLATILAFSWWVFARDAAGILESLRESARMVKGRFFAVIGRMLLVGLIGLAMMLVPVAGWLIGPAWMLVAWSCLFQDLRPARVPRPAAAPVRRGLPITALGRQKA
jgi:hypothetical protein